MKKITILSIAFVFMLLLVGCDSNTSIENKNTGKAVIQVSSEPISK